jgi:hypothetical protein
MVNTFPRVEVRARSALYLNKRNRRHDSLIGRGSGSVGADPDGVAGLEKLRVLGQFAPGEPHALTGVG